MAGGTTIILTTHYLEEADELADRIAVLDGGRIVAEGSAQELKRLVPGGYVRVRFGDRSGLDTAAGELDDAVRVEDALALDVPSDGGVEAVRGVLDRLDATGVPVEELSMHSPDLDDVFLALTGDRDQHAAKAPA